VNFKGLPLRGKIHRRPWWGFRAARWWGFRAAHYGRTLISTFGSDDLRQAAAQRVRLGVSPWQQTQQQDAGHAAEEGQLRLWADQAGVQREGLGTVLGSGERERGRERGRETERDREALSLSL